MSETSMFTFPMDWDEWDREWKQWVRSHRDDLTPVRKAIPGMNFLADDILGTYRLPNGRTVELSEVTFPNLSEREPQTGRLLDDYVRGIGLTFVDDRSGDVVHSFGKLEEALGIDHA